MRGKVIQLGEPEEPEYAAAKDRANAATRALLARGITTSTWDDLAL
jgi:hypothetical protein